MKLYNRLYNTVWLAFFCCMFVPRWMGEGLGGAVHGLLGIMMLALTFDNARRLAALPVPPRLQRVSRVTVRFAGFQLAVGVGLGALAHLAPTLPVIGTVLRVAHVASALAILAQASSVATGYDMWEEKECCPPAAATNPTDA